MIGVALYPMGVYVVFQGLFLYLPLCYPRYAASLFAASDMTRCTFGMAAVLFAKPLYTTLGIAPVCSLLAGLMICCIFVILALYKYGPTLRKRSKFTTDTL
jgi:DHA1 family multidrug resistance protein-like MFS transporter